MYNEPITLTKLRDKLMHDYNEIRKIGKGPDSFQTYLRDCLKVLDEREKEVKTYRFGGNLTEGEAKANLDLIEEIRSKIKQILTTFDGLNPPPLGGGYKP
jgi:DNA-directed RNA polymerase specialized sigma subunit